MAVLLNPLVFIVFDSGRHLSSHIVANCIIFSNFSGCAVKSTAKLRIFGVIAKFCNCYFATFIRR
jgi:hypothetical protein